MLKGKHILLGVTGSIAAYKSATLARLLVKEGAEVRVVMTNLAKEFITPLTMATVSRNPILVEFFDPENGAWNSHVTLGEWADLFLIAPATANTLAKMTYGVADNLLLTTYLSARCPVAVAPAMDLDMYAHITTQSNLDALRSRGVKVVEPGAGELASGLIGKGRMAEPEDIVEGIKDIFARGGADMNEKSLAGKRFLVTAGATIEAIDPVRYITNHSTGKMGYAIAGELARKGASVVLVSGKTVLDTPKGVERVDVRSADEMYRETMARIEDIDGAVMCAAVADYTPAEVSDKKIKKSDGGMSIELRRTKDIAKEVGKVIDRERSVFVGFALETDNELYNAQDKLNRKGFDFIVLNSLRDKGAGFGVDTNKITIVERDGTEENYPLESKTDAAVRIVDKMERTLLDKLDK